VTCRGSGCRAIARLWANAWAEFVPFLAFDRGIRTLICTTNAIESVNSRYRRAVNAFEITFDGRLSAGRKQTPTQDHLRR
jgi:transposase-like protein